MSAFHYHRQPLLPYFTPDNKQRRSKKAVSQNLDRLLSRAPPQGNFNVNYDAYTVRIPKYSFGKATLLPGSGGLMAIAIGKRTADGWPVLAKLSPYAIRLEREYYIARRLYAQADGKKYIPEVVELISLPQDGLTALIYADYGANDLSYLEQRYFSHYRLSVSAPTSPAKDNDDDPNYHDNDGLGTSTADNPSNPLFDLETFLSFAIECCSCLQFLHANGIIHGELRPSAFHWRRQKDGITVKIWNFGAGLRSYEEILLTSSGWRRAVMAAAVQDEEGGQPHHHHHHRHSQSRLSSSKSFQNTLAYVSPEQTGRTSNVLDHRTDLYSLGIMFFVILTGQPPFEGSAMDVIHAALSSNVPLVHTIRKDVPPVISLIIDKLTRKAVDERYDSAYGLREDLLECQRRLNCSSALESLVFFPLGLHDINSIFQFPSNIYGRDREIDLIRTVTRRVSMAHEQEISKGQLVRTSDLSSSDPHIRTTKTGCEMVVVLGNGGVGKSSLVSMIYTQARQYGYMATSKFDSNQKRPYNGLLRCLSSILRQLLTESEAVIRDFYEDLKEQLGPQFSNVRLMVDMVPELKPILSDYERDSCQEEDDVLSNVFLNVIRTIARKKMITLCLDDLQEADEPSLHLISTLIASRITMLIIVTCRDNEELPESVRHLIEPEEDEDGVSDAHMTVIKLAPLGVDAIIQLVSQTLHRTSEEVQPLADIIFHRTRGNPFYAKQFMMMMKRKDDIWLDWKEKQWNFRLDNVAHILYPPKKTVQVQNELDGVLDVCHLVSHVRELDQCAQIFLMWASLIGTIFDFRQIKWLMMAIDVLTEDGDQNSELSDSSTTMDEEEYHAMLESGVVMGHDGLQMHDENKYANMAMAGLQVALQEGIIQPKTGTEFQFIHDRYCQAASMLVDDKDRERMHLKIGQMLMLDHGADVFLTADHFVKSIDIIQRFSLRAKYRQTLIKAGDAASSSGALQIAWTYYECAMSLLNQDPWQDGPDASYQETLNLYLKMSEQQLQLWNQRAEATKLLDEIMVRTAARPVDRALAWRLKARMCFQHQQHDEGIAAILQALRELGVEGIHQDVSEEQVKEMYEQVKTSILEHGFQKLTEYGPCYDRHTLAIMYLLNEACTGAYWMNRRLLDYAALILVQLSLDHGYGMASGGGFIWLGCTAARLTEYKLGAKLGELGLAISEKHAGNSEIARAIIIHYINLSQWTETWYQDHVAQFRRAYKYAIAGGDKIFSAMALFHISSTLYFTGRNLSEVSWHLNHSIEECGEDSSKDVLILNISLWRSILAFQGKTAMEAHKILDDPIDEDGECFEEHHFVQNMCAQNISPGSPLIWHWSLKIVVLYHFGFYQEAVGLGFKIQEVSSNHPGHRHKAIALFYHSLSMIAWIRDETLDETTHEKYMVDVLENQRTLGEWADHSEENYRMYHKLVDAEIASLSKDMDTIVRLYNETIDLALKSQRKPFLGLAYQLAAEYYIRAGLSMLALPLLTQSMEFYNLWGACGQTRFLMERHSDILKRQVSLGQSVDAGTQTDVEMSSMDSMWEDESPEPSLRELYGDESLTGLAESETAVFSLDIVDLTTIIKSSQVISNEMNSFNELLKKMMTIILTNSGAEAGAIIIKEGSFGIAAHSTRSTCDTFEPPIPLNDDNELITSLVVHYVIHTQTMLFIPNIQEDTRFATGTWFARTGPKSVICMPILHKNTLVGVLYLHANLNTFTRKHITVLSLLCDQIGISITNALLFKSVQKASRTNAEALEEARRSREQALKATKLKSNFLANMSHELRTPFSGFYGMISLLSETRLDTEQREFVLIAKQSCEMLLHIIDDLLDFSKLEARKVKLHSGLFYIEDLMADRMELLITLASNKNLELTYFMDPNVPPMVYGDGNRIGQILMNLIGNAIKFTHIGEVTVRCTVEENVKYDPPLKDEEMMLKFSVRDTGIGMTKEAIKCLFLPFSQVDGSTTRNFGGTGLGLSICLELVRLMGGDIWVESKENMGSTFYFRVRVMKASSVAEPGIMDPRTSEVKSLIQRLHNPKVILATSSRQAAMFEIMLPDLDFERVESPEEALDRKCDYIVVDMPRAETVKRLVDAIEASRRQTHVVMLYAPTVENIKRQIAGSTDHSTFHPNVTRISKPIRRLKFLNALIKTHPEPLVVERSFSASYMNQNREGFTPEELAIFQNQKILVAEDNEVAQKLIVRQLARLGFMVETCNNGFECIDTWTQRGPGYFLLAWIDHHMPGCDGIEATKKIRSLERELNVATPMPIIALTADIQKVAQQSCLDAGMNDYVTKPLMQKDLVTILRRYCSPVLS
ncbi:hypothetical protein EC973_004178 [Apophysomyces ossiformis]|uniref:histidine kinase n=1 Tax=Apophysomyces ossiformis TaxID=679940 RepID=A0A8H7BIJ4_9FUNG|nr:hypothetical protein EC973_004178 [Apophysomyces ossiformis]